MTRVITDDEYLESLEEEARSASTPRRRATDEPLPPIVRAIDAPKATPISWLIEDFWTAGDIGLYVGDDGSFKSTAAIHTAGAIAGGYKVFEHFETTQRRALIVSAEDPQSIVQLRLEAFIAGHGWDRQRVLSNVDYLASPDVCLADVRWQAHLLAAVREGDYGFIVLDPLAELLAGEENSNSDFRPLVKFARVLTAQANAGVLIVHHLGKAAENKRAIDRVRGASAIRSASRVTHAFDFLPDGIAVQNWKMSRAPKLHPFIVKREIHSEEGNRAMWTSARLTYADAKAAAMDRGEQFILAQLRMRPGQRWNSSELRKLANGTGVKKEDIGTALTTLQAKGLIDWVKGEKKNEKRWGIPDGNGSSET